LFKDRIKRPKVVVDLGQIKELRGIREINGKLEIGAMTTLTAAARHRLLYSPNHQVLIKFRHDFNNINLGHYSCLADLKV